MAVLGEEYKLEYTTRRNPGVWVFGWIGNKEEVNGRRVAYVKHPDVSKVRVVKISKEVVWQTD